MTGAHFVSKGLENLRKAWSVDRLRPLIAREVDFVGQRINRAMGRQSLYRMSLRRGDLRSRLNVSGGYVPTGIIMEGAGELERPKGRPLHVIRTKGTSGRSPPRDLVRVRFTATGRGKRRRRLGQRKVLAGLYQRARIAGARSLAGLGADWLLARRIAHSPGLHKHRVQSQLRKQTRTLERRMGFLLRRRGLA